jgi:sulfate adenylyltransferase
MSLVAPHGGKLVNRILESSAAQSAIKEAASLPSLTLSPREQFDLEMIAIGAFSPLTGFMGKADFESVCKDMRLASGVVWPIPVTLCPPNDQAEKIRVGDKLALKDPQGRVLALMTISEKYPHEPRSRIPRIPPPAR